MIVSVNWLKKYVDIDVSVEELAKLIGARLVEVEEVVRIGEKYKGAVIVKVEKAEKIDGSDHLSLCLVDDGGVVKGVKREGGLVQVVCGADNVYAGMVAVWLPPKTVVPKTWGTDESFVLDVRKLQGYESNGMLASADELDLGADHDGIVELEPGMVDRVGESFAKVFDFEDEVLLDIENKSLTHRPDCFGIVGFAREVAGILGKEFKTPDWLASSTILSESAGLVERSAQRITSMPAEAGGDSDSLASPSTMSAKGIVLERISTNQALVAKQQSESADELSVEVEIEDEVLCPRYQAVVMEVGEMENYLEEIQTWIARSGMRAIDPVVDVTNYLMLLSGQPLHAFDYDKLVEVGGLKNAKIVVRAAKKGEKMELLDGKTIELSEDDILITSNDVPVALAGAMGAKNTVIDSSTKRIIIESATFSLYNLRRTQMRHGIFSEAITRFTKGQSAELTESVLVRAISELEERAGAKLVSEIFEAYPGKSEAAAVKISAEEINGILGTEYSWGLIETTLWNVGFTVSCECGASGKCECEFVNVVAPYWRTDIRIREDIVEEVGRINGYDNVPFTLPMRKFEGVEVDELGDLKARMRAILSSAGANEVLTYSFVHSDLIRKAGQDIENSYRLTNSISPDLECIRQSLTPSLLDKVYMNVRAGHDEFAIFEMNRISQKADGVNDEGVPVEKDKLALVFCDRKGEGAAYYRAKRYLEFLMRKLGVSVELRPLESVSASTARPFEKKRAAGIYERESGQVLGIVGEYRGAVRRAFKLPDYVAGFEFDVGNLMKVLGSDVKYEAPSKYPSVERDVCFKVGSEVEYGKLEGVVRAVMGDLGWQYELTPVSIYQGEDLTTKNVAVKVRFASMEKTLDKNEVVEVVEELARRAGEELGAEII